MNDLILTLLARLMRSILELEAALTKAQETQCPDPKAHE